MVKAEKRSTTVTTSHIMSTTRSSVDNQLPDAPNPRTKSANDSGKHTDVDIYNLKARKRQG